MWYEYVFALLVQVERMLLHIEIDVTSTCRITVGHTTLEGPATCAPESS